MGTRLRAESPLAMRALPGAIHRACIRSHWLSRFCLKVWDLGGDLSEGGAWRTSIITTYTFLLLYNRASHGAL